MITGLTAKRGGGYAALLRVGYLIYINIYIYIYININININVDININIHIHINVNVNIHINNNNNNNIKAGAKVTSCQLPGRRCQPGLA